jgi:glutathione synthase/RimK-type ligase-like ATP-grasp enzyme
LDNYNQIIIKSSIGRLGRGIIKVASHGDRKYEVHIEYKKMVVNGREKTYKIVCDNLRKKKYIVQEVIPLATYHNRPFAIRVMVQRKKDSLKWNVTGKAVNGFFITNVAKEIVTIEEAFKESQLLGNLFYVALAKIDDSPFDIRVIVQRKIGSNEWNITGCYAKVAKTGFFKTNLAAGGTVLPVEEAIKRSSIDKSIDILHLCYRLITSA